MVGDCSVRDTQTTLGVLRTYRADLGDVLGIMWSQESKAGLVLMPDIE